MIKNINYLEKVLEKFDNSQKHDFLSLYWNLWSDNDDDVGTDYCFGFINPHVSEVLIDTLSKVGDNKLLFYPDVGLISDDIEVFSLEKTVEMIFDFQKEGFLSTDLTTRFYIFDTTSTWLIHVDESVLFSADKSLFSSLVKKMGGKHSVLESMQYDLKFCSGNAKSWREKIIENFEKNS